MIEIVATIPVEVLIFFVVFSILSFFEPRLLSVLFLVGSLLLLLMKLS